MTAGYFLRNGVHFCICGNAVVFLDLRNDEYSMIESDRATSFQALLRCAPKRSSQFSDLRATLPHRDESVIDLIEELLRAGLLTMDRTCGRPLDPTRADIPVEHLVDSTEIDLRACRIHIAHVYRFFAACIQAALRLRFRPIESTVQTVRRRKMQRGARRTVDRCAARRLVTIFNRLRAFFPHNYLCLFDSLALIEFLARYGVFPDWVFSVRSEPWAAHCWVQAGHTIFNEDVEEAEDYVPIMVV